MKRKACFSCLVILVLSVPVNIFLILNTSVSMKYKTNNIEDCISKISENDLCKSF